MSLFSSLNIALQGLNASQSAIDITGQNITNANTAGYSRKVIDLEAQSRPDATFGEIGTGVNLADVTRMTDVFVNQQIQQQSGLQGYYNQMDTTLNSMQNVVNEPQTGSLNDALGTFFSSWQDVANNPSDLSARQSLQSAASALTDAFHTQADGMQQYSAGMSGTLTQTVNQANNLMKQISSLNTVIATEEAQQNGNANDSRDQRDALVTQLSGLMDVTATEDAQGHETISSGGVMLVGPSNYMPLETYTNTATLADGTQYNTLSVRLQNGKQPVHIQSGSIKAILDTVDTVIPAYQDKLNTLAAGLVQGVNTLHESGFTLNQTTGVDFFDPSKTGAGNISLSDAVQSDLNNIAAATGGTSLPANITPAGGVPPVANPTLDLKTLNPQYRYLVDGSVQITGPGGQPLQEGAGKDYVVDYSQGTITFLNYNSLAPGDAIHIDLRYAQNGFPGSGDGSNALSISQLNQKLTLAPDASGNPTQSLGDYYSATIAGLGSASNQNTTALHTQNNVITQLTQEQSSVSGVSIDEEMTNLIKYQNSYQASARIVSTVDAMLTSLIAIT